MSNKEHQRICDVLLGQVTVGDLVTKPVYSFNPGTSVGEALRDLEDRDFDSAPINEPTIHRSINRQALRGVRGCVEDQATPIMQHQIISSDAGVLELLGSLEDAETLYVCTDGSIDRIVTRSDLQKPIVGAAVYGLIISLETSLSDLIEIYSHGNWKGLLSSEQSESFARIREDRHQRNSALRHIDCLDLTAKFHCIEQLDELRKDLGMGSGKKVKKSKRVVRDLRNALAHGVSVFDMHTELTKTLRVINRLSALAQRAAELVDDGDFIWDAYGSTQIEDEDEICALEGLDVLHLITAFNPISRRATSENNTAANARLRSHLDAIEGATLVAEVEASSPQGAWSETSLVVAGISRSQACDVGSRYDQRAIFEVMSNKVLVIECATGVVKRSRDVPDAREGKKLQLVSGRSS